jgi:hypothetical protein
MFADISALEIVSLLGLGLLAWLWFDATRARDNAVAAARAACRGEHLQLLDDTVVASSLKFARNAEGRLLLRRVYDFEYSDTGDNRRRGSLVMVGHRVIDIDVGLRLSAVVRTIH